MSKDREDDIISEAQAECFKGMLKIKDFLQTAISSRAKARLIGKAQYERQEAVLKYLDAMPSTAYATLLGAAVFGREKFQRLLRATV